MDLKSVIWSREAAHKDARKRVTARPPRCPAERENPTRVQGLLPESQGQNLALNVLCVPYSLDVAAHEDALKRVSYHHRLRVGWLDAFSFITLHGAARAEDAQGTPS